MWDGYKSLGCWDELLVDGHPRPACDGVARYLVSLGDDLAGRQEAAELAIRSMGITFSVYSEAANIDRDWPFGDLYGAARVVAEPSTETMLQSA